MAESRPPLSPDQIAYVESASSILVGTCDAERVPEGIRGVGVRVLQGHERVEVLVPTAVAARTLANLAATSRIAVTTAALPTFGTIQLKGRVLSVRDGADADRALATELQTRFAAEFAWAGKQIVASSRIAVWPCTVIELAVDAIYTEAPSP